MEISPILLARLLMYSFFLGLGVGVFYDINRILRVFLGAIDVTNGQKSIRLKLPFTDRYMCSSKGKTASGIVRGTAVFFSDLFTVLAASSGLLILNYGYNSGRFRFFTVIGALVGFLLYYYTFGKLTVNVLAPIAFFAKYVFFAFFVILWTPFAFFAKIVIKNIRKLYILCENALEKRRKKEYNIYEKVSLLRMSKNGFLDDSFTDEEEALSNKDQEV